MKISSFDIFDTLIQRMTLIPTDVFHIVEKEVKAKKISADHFAKMRLETERELTLPNIYQIYDALGHKYGWSLEEKNIILDLELATERQVINTRTEIAELFDFAIAQEKKVVLTSDMYLPEPILRQLLAAVGIQGYSKLFVSCDVGKSKCDGLYESLLADILYKRGEKLYYYKR